MISADSASQHKIFLSLFYFFLSAGRVTRRIFSLKCLQKQVNFDDTGKKKAFSAARTRGCRRHAAYFGFRHATISFQSAAQGDEMERSTPAQVSPRHARTISRTSGDAGNAQRSKITFQALLFSPRGRYGAAAATADRWALHLAPASRSAGHLPQNDQPVSQEVGDELQGRPRKIALCWHAAAPRARYHRQNYLALARADAHRSAGLKARMKAHIMSIALLSPAPATYRRRPHTRTVDGRVGLIGRCRQSISARCQ